MNSEIQERLQEHYIVNAIKTQRRMEGEKVVKKVTDFRSTRRRPKGRCKERVLEDIKRLKIYEAR